MNFFEFEQQVKSALKQLSYQRVLVHFVALLVLLGVGGIGFVIMVHCFTGALNHASGTWVDNVLFPSLFLFGLGVFGFWAMSVYNIAKGLFVRDD